MWAILRELESHLKSSGIAHALLIPMGSIARFREEKESCWAQYEDPVPYQFQEFILFHYFPISYFIIFSLPSCYVLQFYIVDKFASGLGPGILTLLRRHCKTTFDEFKIIIKFIKCKGRKISNPFKVETKASVHITGVRLRKISTVTTATIQKNSPPTSR